MILAISFLCNAGMLTISPMTVAPVCQVGDPLNFTCTASVEFISWNINEQSMKRVINDEPINSEDSLQMPDPIVTDLATFTFMRMSAQFSLPLISTLSIDSVSIGLNGSVVNCMDGRDRVTNRLMSASTTIQIIDTSQSKLVLIPHKLLSWLMILFLINRRSIDSRIKHFRTAL